MAHLSFANAPLFQGDAARTAFEPKAKSGGGGHHQATAQIAIVLRNFRRIKLAARATTQIWLAIIYCNLGKGSRTLSAPFDLWCNDDDEKVDTRRPPRHNFARLQTQLSENNGNQFSRQYHSQELRLCKMLACVNKCWRKSFDACALSLSLSVSTIDFRAVVAGKFSF